MKYVLLIGLFFYSLTSFAQEIIISGKIVDQQNQQVLPFSTISLIEKESEKLITGAVSDGEGRFEISGDLKGKYLLKVSFIGFKEFTKDVLIGELNTYFDIGTVQLIPSSEQMDEVSIKAKKATISSVIRFITNTL